MKVLLVDDHPIVRDGIRRLLAAEPQVAVEEATNGEDALAAYKSNRPQMVILDLNLPGIGGLELMGRLRNEDPGVRVLVLSMHDNPIYVTRALEAGALGYVSKGAAPEQILEAIGRVARGQSYIEHRIAEELVLHNVRPSAQPLKELSRRELEILRLLGEGRSITQIGSTLGIGYKTVANSCSQIKSKLGVARTADLVRIAVQNCVSPDR